MEVVEAVHQMNVKPRARGRAAGRVRLAAFALVAGLAMQATAQESETIYGGSVEAGQQKTATCAACHGADGNSISPDWPSLAGQHPAYLYNQLEAYKTGERLDPNMVAMAAPLSEQDMRDIAAYYSVQPLTPKGADPEVVVRGEEIYRGGIPERNVPACMACHGPTGMGNYLAAYPRISGQHSAYLLTTMRHYASGERRSDASYNQMMRNVAELLLEDEMRAVVGYVQGLTE